MTPMTEPSATAAAGPGKRLGPVSGIVAIHGAGMDRSVWDTLEARLDDAGVPIAAPDLPGHGEDTARTCDRIEDMADVLAAGLEADGAPPGLILGHSMGALVAMELARRYPERVLALILIGVARPMRVNPDLIDLAERAPVEAAALIARLAHAKSAPPSHLAATDALLAGARPGVLARDLRACAAYDMARAVDALRAMPVGLILGESDRMTPLDGGLALARDLGTGAVAVLPFAGHMMMIDTARETAEAVLDLAATLALDGEP